MSAGAYGFTTCINDNSRFPKGRRLLVKYRRMLTSCCKHPNKCIWQFVQEGYNFAVLTQSHMLTREQIEEIRSESREKGISIKSLLREKGIPNNQYYWWCRKYAKEDIPSGFVPVSGGCLPAGMAASSAQSGSRAGKPKAAESIENWVSIELRTASGADMRIQGGLTPAMVYTILKSV